MNWEEAANGSSDENLPEGYHRVKITEVARTNKEGEPYESQKGPFFRYYVKNAAGQSAGNSIWLTEKTAWKFARILGLIGHDLKTMTEQGIGIADFESEEMLANYLKGHSVWVHVEHAGDYANSEIVDESAVPPQVLQAASGKVPAKSPELVPPDDEIPF